MNNSFFTIEHVNLRTEEPVDITEKLRDREQKLTKLIESIEGMRKSKHWSSLKEEVFDGLITRLKTELFDAANTPVPDVIAISRLSGKLETAESYNLDKLEQRYRNELLNIKKQLYGTKD